MLNVSSILMTFFFVSRGRIWEVFEVKVNIVRFINIIEKHAFPKNEKAILPLYYGGRDWKNNRSLSVPPYNLSPSLTPSLSLTILALFGILWLRIIR